MRIVSYAEYHTIAPGEARARAFLMSDTVPQIFPTDNAWTDSPVHVTFMPMSVLYITDSSAKNQVCIIKEDGTWTPLNGTISLMM